MEIIASATMQAWRLALQHITEEGEEFIDSNGRMSREVLNLKVTIEKPGQDIEEPINIIRRSGGWVYPSLDEIASIVMSRQISPAFTYSYGHRIFNFTNTLNQIDGYVVPLLRDDQQSRRAFVSVWNPLQDSKKYNKLVPGLVGMHFIIRRKKLQVLSIVRSNDYYFGWPANCYQSYIILTYASEKLGVDPGSISVLSISAHIFKDELAHIQKVLAH
jgi:thymidylate synthase